ncbi:MAG: hypothetical protein GQ574_06215 [Crocinitomix sp.]|nr:hypothetical protein [Crocinitomix sp.]
MKKILFALILSFGFINANSQIVEEYGGGYVSDNTVLDKIDIEEVGRSIHVASVEEGKLRVRRFYRGKWEEFDQTPIEGIFKLKALEIFAYKAVPYVFCYYDDKMSVIRAIDDKWEYVGEKDFGVGSINNPEFSVIGEEAYVIYEDKDYEMIRMFSLLDETWYDVDVMPMEGVKSYKLAANFRGDLFMAVMDAEGIIIKEVDQLIASMDEWNDLTKKIKLEDIARIDDFEFVENKAYITYSTTTGPVIISLEDLSKKWETIEDAADAEVPFELGKADYNLNISEYHFFTSMSSTGIPQYVKNNKRGVWGAVTNLSDKKAKSLASCEYRNIIYAAYVDNATGKLMVKKIEKGELEDNKKPVVPTKDDKKDDKKKKKK